ncbi:hypothetical protein K461DRAFT_273568 [Myriangium duriaei CBS 260.36]|uniref:Uncharacterized protein n=1 Tax=Myriangium duriaei CBS 260.36 TaxID=1168546 RepID=A0A9P4J8Q2_9PEZI|nr:hypothetical protein K461DRAFT_273568 [Myriangium duriaei CBS 260.36]
MSSGRSNGTPQGRITRNAAPSSRNTASPLTPRLAANANNTGRREPSPRRPFVKAASVSRSTSPEKSIVTPAKALTSDNATPRSSTRGKIKPGSATSTPGTSTPGSVKAGNAYVSPRVVGFNTPSERDAVRPRIATSVLGIQQSREGSALSPLAQDPLMASAHGPEDMTIKNHSSMFFHADEARSREKPTTAPAPTKRNNTAFFYANGQREQPSQPRVVRPASPAMSMFIDKRPAAPNASRGGTSELGLSTRPMITSPTLSAISSARSPFMASPVSLSPPILSPPLHKIDYLNTPHATLNHSKIRPEKSSYDSPSPHTPGSTGLGVTLPSAIEPTIGQSPSRHVKSSSICAISVESPSATRKRSATWTEAHSPASAKPGVTDVAERSQPPSPTTQRTITTPALTSPAINDALQSPTKELVDFAADARRERKVLDLEISNSSLLAINRSLEREIKKHKAELKRYRRLSRAGRFSVAAGDSYNGDYDAADGLPHVDGAFVGRPSSPFQEDVSDMELSNEEESSEDGSSLSPGAESSKEERQRAKDEAQLRSDLRKHRELLLDTARMNRSLQRCLTWTEDLIKDGKKALDHRIPSSEIRLGGRVLHADDSDDEVATEHDVDQSIVEPIESEQTMDDVGDDLAGIEAFLGISGGQWQVQNPERLSIESEGTNRDSGVEMGKQNPHRTLDRASARAA